MSSITCITRSLKVTDMATSLPMPLPGELSRPIPNSCVVRSLSSNCFFGSFGRRCRRTTRICSSSCPATPPTSLFIRHVTMSARVNFAPMIPPSTQKARYWATRACHELRMMLASAVSHSAHETPSLGPCSFSRTMLSGSMSCSSVASHRARARWQISSQISGCESTPSSRMIFSMPLTKRHVYFSRQLLPSGRSRRRLRIQA
mmetsp:Transcript_72867/g.191023  ORF Transcript_72867/g.191023 Transcript_72867/m.191023 type:complete len:203 (+) Transcript_72867:975-1583(+)